MAETTVCLLVGVLSPIETVAVAWTVVPRRTVHGCRSYLWRVAVMCYSVVINGFVSSGGV